jgi:hypothetical protein
MIMVSVGNDFFELNDKSDKIRRGEDIAAKNNYTIFNERIEG